MTPTNLTEEEKPFVFKCYICGEYPKWWHWFDAKIDALICYGPDECPHPAMGVTFHESKLIVREDWNHKMRKLFIREIEKNCAENNGRGIEPYITKYGVLDRDYDLRISKLNGEGDDT